MSSDSTNGPLSLERLRRAVQHEAAIRLIARLQPAGGAGDKVFPAIYPKDNGQAGGRYATESRWLNGSKVDAVLLDSVQSQANRMELALQAASDRGELRLPLLVVDFTSDFPDLGRITTLTAPHRIADAIFRDSELGGKRFRDSEAGQRFIKCRTDAATALFELCPTALIFGVWDSTGEQGGGGTKFERTLVSEIVGYQVVEGIKTQSRIDPLQIGREVAIYQAVEGDWTCNDVEAKKDKEGRPIPYGDNRDTRGKPSAMNHGNIMPSISDPGGVTISHAIQTTVLSLAGLRRLHFPLGKSKPHPDIDVSAQTLLAALALTAIAYQRREGYDLRSRCLLVPDSPTLFEFLPNDGSASESFTLTSQQAREIFEQAADKAISQGLPWSTAEMALTPSKKLLSMIRRNRELRSPQPEA